jgi:hypothetical protein
VEPSDWPPAEASTYRQDKSLKHRGLTHATTPVSVFIDPSTAAQDDLLDLTRRKGAVRIDKAGRTNLIAKPGPVIGRLYSTGGSVIHDEDVCLVALSTNAAKVHPFSQSSTKYPDDCDRCAGPLFGSPGGRA